MKKILLGTTTLIGAAALLAGNAFADTPKVTIGGYENFEMGYAQDNFSNQTTSGHPNSVDQQPQAFRSDTQVDFKIDGKNDAGLGYGGEVDLLADTSADVQGRGVNASKTFIYGDGNWGRFELGSNVGADGTMKVDAGTIARATGGINGDWSYFANASTQFLGMAALPLAYGQMNVNANTTGPTGAGTVDLLGNHTEENLEKVTYYTPRFYGVQMGLSYLPDQINRGQGFVNTTLPNSIGPDRSYDNAGLSHNIFAGGINYDQKFGDVDFTTAATGEYGKSELSTYEDLKAWNAGAKLSYMGWSVAGSYGNWGNSNTLAADHAKDTYYWDAGIAYEYGPFGASVTYLNSTFDCGTANTAAGVGSGNTTNCSAAVADTGKNKFDSISTGVDYKLAPGLTPYAEVTYYNQDASVVANQNQGYVGIVGTQLNF